MSYFARDGGEPIAGQPHQEHQAGRRADAAPVTSGAHEQSNEQRANSKTHVAQENEVWLTWTVNINVKADVNGKH